MRNPVVQEIYDAIQKDDINFFPKMKDLMNIYVGGNAMEKLVTREVTILSFLQTMNTYLREPFFLEDRTIQYFNKFLSWHMDEVRKNTVVGTCNLCKEQYDYMSREEWNADLKNCDCGGVIEEVTVHANGGNA